MYSSSESDKRVGRDVSHHPSTISGVTDFDSPDTFLKVMRFLSFPRRNQPSYAWKFSTFNSLANISTFC